MADADGPLMCEHADRGWTVEEAITAVQTAVECALVPLAEALARAPRVIEITWSRRRRARW